MRITLWDGSLHSSPFKVKGCAACHGGTRSVHIYSLNVQLPGYASPSKLIKLAAQLCQKTTSLFVSTTTPRCISYPSHQSARMSAGHRLGSAARFGPGRSLRSAHAGRHEPLRTWTRRRDIPTRWSDDGIVTGRPIRGPGRGAGRHSQGSWTSYILPSRSVAVMWTNRGVTACRFKEFLSTPRNSA